MCFAPQRRALFISHLTTWLRTCRFSEPTFRPSGATNHWKNTVNRKFPTFSRTCIFFLRALSLLWSSLFFSSLLWLLPPLLFHLSILSEVWLLNFLWSYNHIQYVCIYIAGAQVSLPPSRPHIWWGHCPTHKSKLSPATKIVRVTMDCRSSRGLFRGSPESLEKHWFNHPDEKI